MRGKLQPLFLATYPPEQCGIATFTKDLTDAVNLAAGESISRVIAIRKRGELLYYGPRVVHIIDNRKPGAYRQAARFVNSTDGCDIVNIQHEYGLYTGDWGDAILAFAEECKKPIVTTLHTLSPNPEDKPRGIINVLGQLSEKIVVMANLGAELCESRYGVPADKIAVIPHGVPDVAFDHQAVLKRKLGVHGRIVIMTFGLLSRGKGIEYMIQAMPKILESHPSALYLVVGRTHPSVKQREGESYREELVELCRKLKIESKVRFIDRYVTLEELVLYLQACDVYVTPYIGRDQITSGTLSYALAAGCAIVSTPYLYAEEVLSEGRGLLAEFENPDSLSEQILKILGDLRLKEDLEVRAYELGRTMVWPAVGRRYLQLFNRVLGRKPEISLAAPRLIDTEKGVYPAATGLINEVERRVSP